MIQNLNRTCLNYDFPTEKLHSTKKKNSLNFGELLDYVKFHRNQSISSEKLYLSHFYYLLDLLELSPEKLLIWKLAPITKNQCHRHTLFSKLVDLEDMAQPGKYITFVRV